MLLWSFTCTWYRRQTCFVRASMKIDNKLVGQFGTCGPNVTILQGRTIYSRFRLSCWVGVKGSVSENIVQPCTNVGSIWNFWTPHINACISACFAAIVLLITIENWNWGDLLSTRWPSEAEEPLMSWLPLPPSFLMTAAAATAYKVNSTRATFWKIGSLQIFSLEIKCPDMQFCSN